ncbi:MAG: nucleoside monophosphate kinase [Puniceicoccales bacterium]|jgi:adenylate kinase|nr:nucleoside monophosphate kinase [Puniceicoccales bacterium]
MATCQKLYRCALCFTFLAFHAPLPLAAGTIAEKKIMGNSITCSSGAASCDRTGISKGACEIFDKFWREFNGPRGEKKFTAPKIVIWLNGAPGAGKGTNTRHVADRFGIKRKAIVTSDLLNSEEFKKLKEQGKLIDDAAVTKAVFTKLLSGAYSGGAIVDGFPRTAQQAECVKLLYDKILSRNQQSEFRMVLFEVPQNVSVDRQLGRGREATRFNEEVKKTGKGKPIAVRKTDVDPGAARMRYRTYVEQTEHAGDVMKQFFPCHRIDANGSLDQVKDNITATFKHVK